MEWLIAFFIFYLIYRAITSMKNERDNLTKQGGRNGQTKYD